MHYQSPVYIGSTIGRGHSLCMHDSDGTPRTIRRGTGCNGLALGAIYDQRDGDLQGRRKAYKQRQKAVNRAKRRYVAS